ncbi:glyoxalase [Vibrio cholerae]|uniref:VOC family protein n=1 Tax=Vibrio cholerae TaxID=666 RepID=UPI001DBB5AD9|nr:VOC family protein [Vibrio cholerae]EGQ9188414.1 glyoxalase [Vibrio cholerae]EJL6266467.1 glyoxalase [Vibrio cholerae]EJL6281303.1 glyoxalase [Vibrio cholerae]EJX9124116.1 glyoxalase [Vibrio cholerae]EJY0787433.1 glyoxalase [Vibrio cholerae]
MSNLNVLEIKSFVPAQDFTTSKQFYLSLGFELSTEFGDVAYLRLGRCAFLLQNTHQRPHQGNTMMHLLVEDAQSWFDHVKTLQLEERFESKVTDLITQPWGMLEFCLVDPSDVLWRIGQRIG